MKSEILRLFTSLVSWAWPPNISMDYMQKSYDSWLAENRQWIEDICNENSRSRYYCELLNSRSFNDNPERLAAIATTVLSEHEEIDVIIWNENLQKFEVKK